MSNKRRQTTKHLRELAAREGLSQAQVARRLRFSQPAVHRWFSGKSLPSCNSLSRIAVAFPTLAGLAFEAFVEFGREALEADHAR